MRNRRKIKSKRKKNKNKTRTLRVKARGGSKKEGFSIFTVTPPVAYGNKGYVNPDPYFQSK